MKLSILFLFVSFISFAQGPDTLQFYFDTDEHDSFELSSNDNERLKSLYKETRILAILGHCDERGSKEYNLNLSRKRMEFVRRHLKNEGFDVSKSSNEALGESMAESSGLSLSKCRRVDVLFIEPAIEEEEVEEEVPISTSATTNIEDRNTTNSEVPDTFANPALSESAIEKFVDDEETDELEFDLTLLFVNVSTRVLEESKPEMFQLLEIMQNNPTLNATFHGHVCCNPHQELSEGRARAVALFLLEHGIARERVDFLGHSNTQPKVWPEVTDDDRKQNRRVAVVFTKSDA
ncbi:OmpA family protein [Crocinitomicaceae bacterium]|nr:OmpA family protein [Crocinitomicaceae bacterium]MDC0257123.1 OmpA family protein [Crocinitomicaceae bacterium]